MTYCNYFLLCYRSLRIWWKDGSILNIIISYSRVILNLRFLICSGYASRIHELVLISRELSVSDASSLQKYGNRNYVSEANYIEFDGVKVDGKSSEYFCVGYVVSMFF